MPAACVRTEARVHLTSTPAPVSVALDAQMSAAMEMSV